MSHMTNKKKVQREKNNKNRGFSFFNTGTRSMGYSSNNERKDILFRKVNKIEGENI